MSDQEEAQATLRSFQQKMRDWEIEFYPLMVQNAVTARQPALDALRAVFDRFLLSYRDDYGRMSGPDVSSPPDYDPDRDPIVEVESTKNKVVIQVQQKKGIGKIFRYRLGQHTQEWKIEKVDVFSKLKGKWENYLP
jgi:hypothetical protein